MLGGCGILRLVGFGATRDEAYENLRVAMICEYGGKI